MKKIALIITFILSLINLNAQEVTFKQNFLEASTLMEESQYDIALPIWLKLQDEDPANYNISYKIGLCYIKSANDKNKALKYLIESSQNRTKNYDPFSSSEKKSPIEALFYLARAYHLNYDLDSALINYNSFKRKITPKHYLFEKIEHNINECRNAKIALKNPVNIKVNNLGNVINSSAADYSPALSIDESTIYFTSRRIRKDSSNYYSKDFSNGQHYDDIYVSQNIDGLWTEPKLLNISTQAHEATLNISADGYTLFIYKGDEGDGNIYLSQLVDEEWSLPKKIGSDINLKSQETHAHISPDGNTLYFISDREGGIGGSDIYKCNKLPNGEWALAQNIGPDINTIYDEDGIFIHPNGKIMYFSSKGHRGIGGFDIYSSTMDEQGEWSTPVNLGYPVNSTDDDVFFVTSTDGKRGYFSSFKAEGYGQQDIYMISMIDAKEIPLTLLIGYIKVVGSDLPKDALITVNNPSFEKPKLYKPKKDGKFSIILEPNNEYHIEYTAGNFIQQEDLYIPPSSSYQEMNRSISLVDIVFYDSLKINNEKRKYLDDSTAVYTHILDSTNNYLEKIAIDSTNRYNFIVDSTNTYIHIQDSTNTYKRNHEAFYQLFFSFDVKKINTNDIEYLKLIGILERQARETGKVHLSIEGSASKAPGSSYGSNEKLAQNRSKAALKAVTKSLTDRGVSSKDIFVKDQISRVQGIEFDEGIDKNIYINYQYIIVRNPKEAVTEEENSDAFYKLTFDFDVNRINTLSPDYKKLLKTLEKQAKENEEARVYISIEGSASKAPGSSYGSNSKLALSRSIFASSTILNSLTVKGINRKYIIIKDQISRVQGLDFDESIDKNAYLKYQYIIIKAVEKQTAPENKEIVPENKD